jgi:hypothetical protein
MFGHQDDNDNSGTQDNNEISADSIRGVLNTETGDTDMAAPAPDTADSTDSSSPDMPAPPPPPSDAPPTDQSQDWGHPGSPIDEPADSVDSSEPEPISDIIAPAGGSASPSLPTPAPYTPPSVPTSSSFTDNNDDSTQAHELIDIKQKALTKLAPLVDQLDQSPEDKFRTTMMMIQASDDQSLINTAYESALAIEDEKERAQALLDIVNEINYFTQHTAAEN